MRLWVGSVAEQVRQAAAFEAPWLSTEETQRMAGITAPGRRDQFLGGRWLVRRALCALHGGAPGDWRLSAQFDSPPSAVQGPVARGSVLGLSHSGDTVACVLANTRVGIDVERHDRRPLDIAGLAQIVLTANERARLFEVDSVKRKTEFLTLWTLKEASLKAHRLALNIATLGQMETLPVLEADANARVFQVPGYTLALVGLAPSTRLLINGMQANASRAQSWRIGAVN